MRCAAGGASSGSSQIAAAMNATHWAANAQNRPANARPPANAPPTSGPSTVATPQTPVIAPKIRARCRPGNIAPIAA